MAEHQRVENMARERAGLPMGQIGTSLRLVSVNGNTTRLALQGYTMYDAAVARFTTTTGTGNINHFIWQMYSEEGSGKHLGQNEGIRYLFFFLFNIRVPADWRCLGPCYTRLCVNGAYALMAYNQGNDLYAYNGSQISLAEYTAKYNLGFDVPYTPHVVPDYNETVISANGRGTIRPEWELIYAQYSSLKGQNAS
ncbi:hypothetical protein CPB85DRAFT_1438521 [Mucidula mucida]|nr:hypothetical protein CPB85DRAFT_1438521 [Mucidula mucida]